MSGYFLYHSIGTYADKQAELDTALRTFSSAWTAPDDSQWPTVLGCKQQFIDLWAELTGARSREIAITENVTSGLFRVIGALPKQYLKGRTVLVAQDCFPSLHFLLQKIADRFEFTLRTVPVRAQTGYVHDDDFLDAWDSTVGFALVTWVSSTSSHRVDIDRMAQKAREHGTLIGLDITQAVGVVPFRVRDDIAFTFSASLKWLCGVSGACLLHARDDILAQCEPEFCGWFSQGNPFSWDLDRFSYAPDARRFDNGTPSVLASIASTPGLQFVLNTGVEALQRQNAELTSIILEYAQAQDWQVATPIPVQQRGGSIMVRAGSADKAASLVAALRARQLYCDNRDSILRFSPGNVTTVDDVVALCEILKAGL